VLCALLLTQCLLVLARVFCSPSQGTPVMKDLLLNDLWIDLSAKEHQAGQLLPDETVDRILAMVAGKKQQLEAALDCESPPSIRLPQ